MSRDAEFKRYLCSYRYAGAEWMIEIPARDRIDASRRLLAIGMNGTVDGAIEIKVSVVPNWAIVAALICVVAGLIWLGGLR